MEETKIKGSELSLIKPITITLILRGSAPLHIKWLDGDTKVLSNNKIRYTSYNLQMVLNQLNALYQLNPNMILKTSISTI